MKKIIPILLGTVILMLFLTVECYSQKEEEEVKDTSVVEKDRQLEPAKDIENKQEDKSQPVQAENKQEPDKEKVESKKSREQIEATETETEEITPEEDEWGDDVGGAKRIRRRDSRQRQRDIINGGFDTDDMWKY